MQKNEFSAITTEIPKAEWEKNLSIGKFRELQILHVMSRPYSFVGRCKVIGSDGESIVYIKKYRRKANRTYAHQLEKIRRDVEAANYWYDHFSGSQQFRVVKPVLALPEQFISVTAESFGQNLFQLTETHAAYFPKTDAFSKLQTHFRNTGKWLRFKQEKMLVKDAKYSIDELRDYLIVRLNILCDDPRRLFANEYRQKILNFIDLQRDLLTEAALLVTTNHSDFNPGNILVDGETVTVLDFGRLVTGSYLLDLSKLHFQMELFTFKPQFRRRTISALQNALLEGYGEPAVNQQLMFQFLSIRNILTHLANVTRFWQFSAKEQMYNRWVMRREIKMLEQILTQQSTFSSKKTVVL